MWRPPMPPFPSKSWSPPRNPLAFLLVALNPLPEFTLVAALTLLASGTHLLVRRSALLMLLSNSRSPSDPLRKPAASLLPNALRS